MEASDSSSSSPTPKVQTGCNHRALLYYDLTAIPRSNTTCKRCKDRTENWFCLQCKDVLCSRKVKGHMFQHFQQSNHSLAVKCSDLVIYCSLCKEFLDPQAIRKSYNASQDLSSSSKLENLHALMFDVLKLISEPVPSFDSRPPNAQLLGDHDVLALAEEGLQKIFDSGLEALADPQVLKEFLTYSAIVLNYHTCPSELKVCLSSFRDKLSEETSAFLQAQHELKVASNLSASITQKKFVLQQQSSKYAEVKKDILASDEKVANLRAMIKVLESQIKNLDACLTTAVSNRAKTNEILDTIETQVNTARDGLVSDLAQVSAMEGTTQAAKQLITLWQSEWDSLRTTFTKLA